MYAVIKTGGKQYTVKKGDVLKIELLPDDVGKEIQFKEVLMIADGDKVTCGTPLVANAKVKAEVIDHGRHKKVRIIKFRRRKHHMKRMGHRQYYSQVKITAISSKQDK
jgi:large subunit ribosomal protein L21